MAPTGYEVGYTLSGAEWSAGSSQQVSGLTASIAGLENSQSYAFRVRALADGETGAWSETLTATPEAAVPANVSAAATAETAWKTLDVSFDAPAADAGWVLADTQYRVLGLKEGASWTDWAALSGVSEEGGRVSGSTKAGSLAVGRVYEVELRFCGGGACGSASPGVHGATPASAPTDATASAADPVSATALKLA